jgi:RNA polymerase sigma factor (sigma-70 family)
MKPAKEARMDERIKRITDSTPEKMFFDPSFEAPSRNGLLADVALREGKSVFTREQEYQIFRKYNYLKYRVVKLTVGFKGAGEAPAPKPCPPVRLGEKSVLELEGLLARIVELRNIILQANTRLVFRPVGRYFPSESFERDELVSNAYLHVIRAIDGFDYRRGFKFSTYCVSVIKMNLFRDVERLKKIQYELEFSDSLNSASERDCSCLVRENEEYNAEMVRRVFRKIRTSVRKPEQKIEVMKSYFGIGVSRMLLNEIGEKMNLSKERIRQIKLEAMVAAGELVYDP